MSVKITVQQVGDVTILYCAGRITFGEGAITFRETVRNIAARGNQKVLINLSNISYIDNSGIGQLVSGYTNIQNHGGALKLTQITKRVQDLLQKSNLHTVFEVYDDEEVAIRSFRLPFGI
jgi:anti-sigma B factor antagonist